jgi:hypothetical protein
VSDGVGQTIRGHKAPKLRGFPSEIVEPTQNFGGHRSPVQVAREVS